MFASSVLPVCIILAGLMIAGMCQHRLLQQRTAYHLNQVAPHENSPPLVSFVTVAMGGFRGLVVDFLWLRAGELQRLGRYFELVQLADWITKLEPRSAAVWNFHAWNLAYNVSVMMSTPEDSWRWVRHGIELLRDEGLRYNKGAPKIYHELAWLFQHKLGSDVDRHHYYYKQQWIKLMGRHFPNGQLPNHMGANSAIAEELHMNPKKVADFNSRYGPFDWRLPLAHSAYWAAEGLPYASGFDEKSLQRMIHFAIGKSFQEGTLWVDPQTEDYITLPRLEMFERFKNSLESRNRNAPAGSFDEAFRYFLEEAFLFFKLYGEDEKAAGVLDELRQRFPEEVIYQHAEDGTMEYLLGREKQNPERHRIAAIVDARLKKAFLLSGRGAQESAEGALREAKSYWDVYMRPLTNDPLYRNRVGLAPFRHYAKYAFNTILEQVKDPDEKHNVRQFYETIPSYTGAMKPDFPE